MQELGKLADYPGLMAWYRDQFTAPPSTTQPAALLVWRLCEALSAGQIGGVRKWIDGFRVFLGTSQQPLTDFLAAEAICDGCNAQILDLMGLLGEVAVRSDQGDHFFHVMQSGADATRLVVLRFLAAWTSLNTGRLEQCIAECEKVDEPFAALYTLQGQALLELGRVSDAAEVLEIAVKLSPSESLAWFQLAKVNHVLGRHDQAFTALRQCRQILPNSEEVCLYMGLVALDMKASESYAGEALKVLKPLLSNFAANPVVIFTLLKLTCRLGDRRQADEILGGAQWQQMDIRTDIIRLLPPVLRGFHDAGWLDLAAKLLSGIAPAN